MAADPYDDQLFSFCESQGLEEVRRLRKSDNHFHSLDWARVDSWIELKESELRDEAVSISRSARRISAFAFIFSIAAIAINNSDKISKYISWLLE